MRRKPLLAFLNEVMEKSPSVWAGRVRDVKVLLKISDLPESPELDYLKTIKPHELVKLRLRLSSVSLKINKALIFAKEQKVEVPKRLLEHSFELEAKALWALYVFLIARPNLHQAALMTYYKNLLNHSVRIPAR